MTGLPDEIADLEAEIESLFEAAQRCRKISAVAKAAIATGGVLLLLLATGLFRSGAMVFVLALTAIFGGLALLGSNKRTWDEITARIRTLEAQRAALIDRLEF